MELTLQEKRKLIEFFEFLLDKEISKPLGEMNSEAVDNYIKILLDLQDKHVELSPEFIDEQVRKIFHKEETAAPETAKTTKKHYSKNKIWLVAACVTILVALFSILSFSSEKSVVDTLEDFFGTFEFIPFGEEITKDKVSFGKAGKSRHYKSINAFIEKEKINIYIPKTLKVDIISTSTLKGETNIFVTFENSTSTLSIKPNKTLSNETKAICNEIKTINNTKYYVCKIQDTHQIQTYFTYNNSLYTIITETEDDLMNILNNMEEIKYED